MKKHFLVIFLILSLICYQVRDSSALEPLTTYIAASALLHAVAAAGAYVYAKYYKRENGGTRNGNGTKVSSNGNIGRDATVTWVDMSDRNISNKSKDVTAKLNFSDVKDKSLSNKTKYPKLSSIMEKVGTKTINALENKSLSAGDIVSINGVAYKVTPNANDPYPTGFGADYGPRYYNGRIWSSTDSNRIAWGYTAQLESNPPILPVSSGEFAAAVSKKPSVTMPENVYSDYYMELDDMIQSNPNIVHYVDTPDVSSLDSAPDFNLPPAPTASDIAAAQAAAAAAQAVAASSALAAKAAQDAADAYSKWQQTGNPDDKAAWEARERERLLAEADKAKLEAEQAREGAQDAKDAEEEAAGKYNPSPINSGAYGDPSQLGDFGARTNAFLDALKASPIFSFAQNALGNIPGGGSSLYTFSAGRYGQQSFNLSVLSGIFATLKAVILICFGVVCVKIITLKGGSG